MNGGELGLRILVLAIAALTVATAFAALANALS